MPGELPHLRPDRPKDRLKSNDVAPVTRAEANAQTTWVIGEFRKLYSAYRLAEHNLVVAEQNKQTHMTLKLTALFNKAQFQLEWAMGLTPSAVMESVATDLRWITPELKQLRDRSTGDFR
jgi:hypothetical protein